VPRDRHGWTPDLVLKHVAGLLDERDQRYSQRFHDLDEATKTALASAEKAVNKAEAAAEKRFEAVNEFRGTLSDQAATFITRTEVDAAVSRNTERIQELTDRVNRSEGQGSGKDSLRTLALSAVSVVTALGALYVASHK
jgi:hypothetical protein